jgi:Trp operon repressor
VQEVAETRIESGHARIETTQIVDEFLQAECGQRGLTRQLKNHIANIGRQVSCWCGQAVS